MAFLRQKKLAGIMVYNAGRISTYATLGLIFGLLGENIRIIGFQSIFSLIAGIIILLFVFQTVVHKGIPRIRLFKQFNYRIQHFIAAFIQKKKMYGMFMLGVGNGLLPCGMVYLAVTGALATGTIGGGLLFMTAFGLGTFPAMFLVSWFGFVIGITARSTMRKMVPYVVALMGVLLIMRGLGNYLPQSLSTMLPKEIISCHP